MKRQAFTLTELLVVIGVIAVLATLTLISTKAISAGARVSSAVNTVTAALDNGRALAMRRNAVVLVAFRPRFDRNRTDQVVEVVTATEEAVKSAAYWLLETLKLLVEPSGAVAVAAWIAGAIAYAPEAEEVVDVVLVLSGGNADPATVAGWKG